MRRLLCLLLTFFPHAAFAQSSIGGFIDGYASQHAFSGTVLVQAAGAVRYEKSFGLANRQLQVPNTNRTKYWIASITKAFTSVLVLRLHEQGRLALDGTIATYLPDFAGEAAQRVTIHQLLNHTSGMENYDRVNSAEDAITNGMPVYQSPFTSDQLVARFCSGKLVNPPGTVFNYNNADYVILGKIVERIHRAPFEEVLRKEILVPLGLSQTGMLYQKDILPGLADTYFFRDDLETLVNDLPVYQENWYAAGSMYSTARDVLRFANALFRSALLARETLARMLTPGLDDYGYGVWVYDTKVKGREYRVVKRPGRIMGAQAQLYHFLDPDVTVIILSNTGTVDLDDFVAGIGKEVVGKGRWPESRSRKQDLGDASSISSCDRRPQRPPVTPTNASGASQPGLTGS